MRKLDENKALAELAKVMIKVNEQEAVKDQSARLLRAEKEHFETKHRDDFNIDFFKMYDLYIERLEEEAVTAQKNLDEIKPELEESKAAVMEARRKRRVVELLKERRKAEYDYALKKYEQKQMEEANLFSSGRPSFFAETVDETQWTGHVESPEDDDDAELEREREIDAIAEYYQSLGLQDPREQNRR